MFINVLISGDIIGQTFFFLHTIIPLVYIDCPSVEKTPTKTRYKRKEWISQRIIQIGRRYL